MSNVSFSVQFRETQLMKQFDIWCQDLCRMAIPCEETPEYSPQKKEEVVERWTPLGLVELQEISDTLSVESLFQRLHLYQLGDTMSLSFYEVICQRWTDFLKEPHEGVEEPFVFSQWLAQMPARTYKRVLIQSWYKHQWKQLWEQLELSDSLAPTQPSFDLLIRRIVQLYGMKVLVCQNPTSRQEMWMNHEGVISGDEVMTRHFLWRLLHFYHAPIPSYLLIYQQLGLDTRRNPYGKFYAIEVGQHRVKYLSQKQAERLRSKILIPSPTGYYSIGTLDQQAH